MFTNAKHSAIQKFVSTSENHVLPSCYTAGEEKKTEAEGRKIDLLQFHGKEKGNRECAFRNW